MRAKAVTIGVPVHDLEAAVAWYTSAFKLGEPAQIPLEGLIEFNLGPFWLQLVLAPQLAGHEGLSVNISVEDAAEEHARFTKLGLQVSELQRIADVVDFFELTDMDGNKIGFVTELS
jgi:predicted enzyme related to lactoylglutathione lyase